MMRILCASKNKLCFLPSNMHKLRNLEKLDLSQNSLTKFDESLTTFEYLEYLDLSENEIQSLPQTFGSLKLLTYLNLSKNNIESFPSEDIQILGSVKKLDISENRIGELPANLPYLYRMVELRASFNYLEGLPPAINLMKGLEILLVDENYIVTLSENICKTPNLKILDVSNNKIKQWPKAFENLKKKCNCITGHQTSNKRKSTSPKEPSNN
ncbi:plant intracellular Ras-group-related LRR protein 4-like [Octopus sinensis]|uniref:Plant intracellular Ras-group-related LRR protein 4-like n=1 Tax=Octopus sinensis TaxID=2607531 RepID=A0A6P7TXF1_9MOLL|nr:plant intracellular Ras-group-related LRR protein 4-like [Octopus sinensis]